VARGFDGPGDEFEVMVDKVGEMDGMTSMVEFMPERKGQFRPLETHLKDRLRLITNLEYRVALPDNGILPR